MEINATNLEKQHIKLMRIQNCFQRLSSEIALAESYLSKSIKTLNSRSGIVINEASNVVKRDITSALQCLNYELNDVGMSPVSMDIDGIIEYWREQLH